MHDKLTFARMLSEETCEQRGTQYTHDEEKEQHEQLVADGVGC